MTPDEAADERARLVADLGRALQRADQALLEARALWLGLRDLNTNPDDYAGQFPD